MKTTHWEVEKAFMNVVYHGIVLLVWLVIMAGVGSVDTKMAFAAFIFCGAMACWKIVVLFAHVTWLQKVIQLYDKENEVVGK